MKRTTSKYKVLKGSHRKTNPYTYQHDLARLGANMVDVRFITTKKRQKNVIPDVDLSVATFSTKGDLMDVAYFNRRESANAKVEPHADGNSYSALVDVSNNPEGQCFVVSAHCYSGYFVDAEDTEIIATTDKKEQLFHKTIKPSQYECKWDSNMKYGSMIICIVYFHPMTKKWVLKEKFRKIPFANHVMMMSRELVECLHFMWPEKLPKDEPILKSHDFNFDVKKESLIPVEGEITFGTAGFDGEIYVYNTDGKVDKKIKSHSVHTSDGLEPPVSRACKIDLSTLPPTNTYIVFHLSEKLKDSAARQGFFFTTLYKNTEVVARIPCHHIDGASNFNPIVLYRDGYEGPWVGRTMGGRRMHLRGGVWATICPQMFIPVSCFAGDNPIRKMVETMHKFSTYIENHQMSWHCERRKWFEYYVVCQWLPKMDVIGTCDGYFLLYNMSRDKKCKKPFYKSLIVEQDRNPEFKGKIPAYGVNIGEQILVKLYDWDQLSSDDYIGKFEMDWAEMGGGRHMDVNHDIILGKGLDKQYKNVEMKPSFTWKELRGSTEYIHQKYQDYVDHFEKWVELNRRICGMCRIKDEKKEDDFE